MKKNVSIISGMPITGISNLSNPIVGKISNIELEVDDILKCIIAKAKVKEIIPKPLTYQSKIEALTILGALPSDKMNSVLKDMDYSTMKRLFDNPYLTSSVIEKLDITGLTLSTADNNTEFIFTEAMIDAWTGSSTGNLTLSFTSSQREKIMFTDSGGTVRDSAAEIVDNTTYTIGNSSLTIDITDI